MVNANEDPDFALLRECQARNGDAGIEAFERLFQRYKDRVFNLAFRLLGSRADAEDVTQDAFVAVYRKLDEFRFSSRFFTWLYRIVYNLCVDQKRRAASAGGRVDEPLELYQDPQDGPLELLAETEHQRRAMERALERLSPRLREVVVLRYIEELPYAEVAQVLDCSVGTVKSRLSRAHAFLHEILSPLEAGDERLTSGPGEGPIGGRGSPGR